MDRRGFLKAGAATMLAPALPLPAHAAPGWTTEQDRADMMRQLGIAALASPVPPGLTGLS